MYTRRKARFFNGEKKGGAGRVVLISRAVVFTQRVNYRVRPFTSPFELEFHLPFLQYLRLESKCEIQIFSISQLRTDVRKIECFEFRIRWIIFYDGGIIIDEVTVIDQP